MKQNKNTTRDTLTGKRIGNKEVICVDNAIDYVKKQGYIVSRPKEKELMAEIFTIMVGFSIVAIITIFLLSSVKAQTEAFTITEHTDYSIGKNTVYITITENLGKDQTISINNIYGLDNLTDQIDYSDIKEYQSYLSPIYENQLVSTGKYTTTNTTTTGNGTTVHYYDNNQKEINCVSVLVDKSCMNYQTIQIGTEAKFDYLPIVSTKDKTKTGTIKNFINSGIPIGKFQTIQLKYTYTHPIASGIKNLDNNEYNITVNSISGDSSTLDPSWILGQWISCKNVNVTNNWASSDVQFLLNVSYSSLMSFGNFQDLRIVNNTCFKNGTEIPYEFYQIYQNSSALLFARSPSNLSNGINQYSIYYNNPLATNGEQSDDVWKNYIIVYHNKLGQSLSVIKDSSPAHNNGTLYNGIKYNTNNIVFGGNYSLDIGNTSNSRIQSNNFVGLTGNNISTIIAFTNVIDVDGSASARTFPFGWGTTSEYTFNAHDATTATGKWNMCSGGSCIDFTNSRTANGKYAFFITHNTTSINLDYYYNGIFNYTGQFLNTPAIVNSPVVISQRSADLTNSTANVIEQGIEEFRIANVTFSSDYLNRTFDNTNFAMFTFGAEQSQIDSIVRTGQQPSDITFFNLIGMIDSVNYNITSTSAPINLSSIQFFTKTNSSTQNKIIFINGSLRPADANGFTLSGITPSNVSDNFTFVIEHNDVYPATYNLNQNTMDSTIHNYITNTNNGLVKIQLINVTNLDSQYLFMIMANTSSSNTNNLNVFYCNSTYNVGNPSTSGSCVQIGFLNPTPLFNDTENTNSAHQVFPFNSVNGSVSGISITPTSYFVAQGQGWNIYYVNSQSRGGNALTSINNGATYTNQTFTFDAHMHQYSGNDTFYYFACFNTTVNLRTCSATSADLLQLGGLNPSVPVITNPVDNGIYNGTLSINYIASNSPNGYLVYYNISLGDANGNFLIPIIANNSNLLQYNFDTSSVSDGNYTVRVQAIDINGLSSADVAPFEIINHASVVGDNKSLVNFDLTTTAGVLSFILAVIISVGVLVWVNWYLGCFFIAMTGLINILNSSNLFIGFMLIITAMVLAFMPDGKK